MKLTDETNLKFTQAGPGDWPGLALVRAHAEQTMEKSGLYTPEQLDSGVAQLQYRWERGTMWLARDGRRVVGAIGLDGPDTRFWDDNAEALYLYKVMAVPGLGVGPRLVEFAESQARERGLRLLRLDCLRGNPGLHAWWKSQGFKHVRTAAVAGYGAGALFEKEIG
jgi:GNAT superfamily N-acetyltransferase